MTEDNDLLKRMRECPYGSRKTTKLLVEAADRIEALTEQLEDARLDAKEAEAYSVWLEGKLAKAVQHIEWFISEDETNRGDEPMPERRGKTWNEINAYWIEHLDSAIAFVAELKGDKP